jgi:phosphohistidine phosphatase
MDLILWRHAEAFDAEPGESDEERTLTPKGVKQAKKMAEWLTSQLPEGCKILVSPAVRTVQTAEALGRKFKITPEVGLEADAEDLLQAANWPNAREPVLVIGHQPTLGQVAAVLLSGQPQDWEVKKANVWWLVQRDPADIASLHQKAVVSPALLVKA